jgi:ribose transport system permease protein
MGENTQILLALFAVLLVGLAIGMVNGLGIALLRIPPLVMTLGMSAVTQGLILVYTQGQPKGRAAPLLRNLVNKPFLFGVPGILVIWLFVAIAMRFLLTNTSFGRRLFAVGSNRISARLSGIHVERILVSTYALCGAFSALAGFLFVGYTTTVFMNIGGDYVLRSVAAVVIGGTSLAGGIGSYIGSVAGAVVLTVLEAILTTVRIGQAGRYMVHGLVLIVLLVSYGRQRQLRQ